MGQNPNIKPPKKGDLYPLKTQCLKCLGTISQPRERGRKWIGRLRICAPCAAAEWNARNLAAYHASREKRGAVH